MFKKIDIKRIFVPAHIFINTVLICFLLYQTQTKNHSPTIEIQKGTISSDSKTEILDALQSIGVGQLRIHHFLEPHIESGKVYRHCPECMLELQKQEQINPDKVVKEDINAKSENSYASILEK